MTPQIIKVAEEVLRQHRDAGWMERACMDVCHAPRLAKAGRICARRAVVRRVYA